MTDRPAEKDAASAAADEASAAADEASAAADEASAAADEQHVDEDEASAAADEASDNVHVHVPGVRELPLVALRETVIFPEMIVPLQVGRETGALPP